MTLQTEMPTPGTDPRFPVGKFIRPEVLTDGLLRAAIVTLAELPGELRKAVVGLDDAQLDTPYREGGWTVRQLVHHIADSHINAYVRVKLALTEETPTIKPYDEKAWAALADSKGPIGWSLETLEGLHARWVVLLRSLDANQWRRGYLHPDRGPAPMSVEMTALLYEWHSRHHVAHIKQLRRQKGW